jgi:hypothetical protein
VSWVVFLWSSKTGEFSIVKKWWCANVRRGVWVCGEVVGGRGSSISANAGVNGCVWGAWGRVWGVWGLRYGANAMRMWVSGSGEDGGGGGVGRS